MIIKTSKWYRKNLQDELTNLTDQHKEKLQFWDQDVLNIKATGITFVIFFIRFLCIKITKPNFKITIVYDFDSDPTLNVIKKSLMIQESF